MAFHLRIVRFRSWWLSVEYFCVLVELADKYREHHYNIERSSSTLSAPLILLKGRSFFESVKLENSV
jgi:hypothetical protein